MDVPEYMAAQTERMANSLAHFVGSTQADKLQWQPQVTVLSTRLVQAGFDSATGTVWTPPKEGSVPTRSALEQVAECVVVNRMIAAGLRGETPSSPASGEPALVLANAADAQEQLKASGAELAAAIRAMTEEDLERMYQHPRGQFLGANLIMMPLRNMAYHAGQINLIQMLAGDPEFHVPPQWR